MWEAQAIDLLKTPITMAGGAFMTAGTMALISGVGAAMAPFMYLGGMAANALGNSISVDPRTGKRLTKWTDQAAVNTASSVITSTLGGVGMAAKAAGTASTAFTNAVRAINIGTSAGQQGLVYNSSGALTGADFSGFRGVNAAVTGGIGFLSGEISDGLTKSGGNPNGMFSFDTSTFSGAFSSSLMSGAISSTMTTAAEYAKHKTWGAQHSNFSAMATPGLSNVGGLLGMGFSAGITSSQEAAVQAHLENAKQSALELLAKNGNNEASKKAAQDILIGAGYSVGRREEELARLEGIIRDQQEYYSEKLKLHNKHFQAGETDEADAIRAELAAYGFSTDAADNYRAYIVKDFLRNKSQKGYFSAATKMGANGFDEEHGLFYKEDVNGKRTYFVQDGNDMRLVAKHHLPPVGGPNASHMSGSSVTYDSSGLVQISNPEKFAQWEFAQQVGARLNLSVSQSNYSDVLRMFGTRANAEAFMRGGDYDDTHVPNVGPNAAWESRKFSTWWDRAVNVSMSWAEDARDRGSQSGYGLWQALKDTPATMAGGTMEVVDAWVVTPARGLADLAARVLYPGMKPGIAKQERDYHLGSRFHQKRLELMGEVGGTLTAAGGIRILSGLEKSQRVSLFGFRGAGRIDDLKLPNAPHPYQVTGHVGYSFDDGAKIYGFGPSTPSGMSAHEAVSSLKDGAKFSGVISDDTAVFRSVLDRPMVGRDGTLQQIYRLDVEMSPTEFNAVRRAHDSMGVDKVIDDVYYGFPGQNACTFNCATFPGKLGVPLPESSGRMRQYMERLRSIGKIWRGK
jgi:hypothetical protein